MKINGNAIKPGNIIEHQNAQWRAIKCMAVKPGKGGAFNQVELKNLKTGSKLNERFRANEVVEKLSIDTRPYQYLFSSDEMLTFMDSETFEQIELSISLIGEQKAFLKDGFTIQTTIRASKTKLPRDNNLGIEAGFISNPLLRWAVGSAIY